ncbi:PHD/FYVE-zinc-finger like domain-containing protein [Annulohypoxylon maeteangense]|uniref:PHD/FYVE-zinc-finger like domain-containing protein n=1 Tax=Annulohypoxylon maeteangense TaxID=1927788 RepID=UPI002007F60D|nr:PHD/FYVE-zinc-finger like domain-containing protein [Annulohypoxylon maeteangense]KAI0881702.1 PHD/FYVE-zinc-finger like domain-containing protein [Annulohypoxylon maeteangense]
MDSSEAEDDAMRRELLGLSENSSYDGNDMDDSLVSRTRRSRGTRSEPPPRSKQYPIQVVLRPPPDPTEYQRIEPSQSVERVLGEIEVEDEVFYSVEYDDGYIEKVAYDDILQLQNGPEAAQQFQQQRYVDPTVSARSTSKRPHSEDEYYDSSDTDHRRKKRQRPPARLDYVSARHSVTRMSGQISGRASMENDQANGAVDEWDEVDSKNRYSDFVGPSAGRITRSKNPVFRSRQVQDDSEDELAQSGPTANQDDEDGDDDFIPIVRSDINGATRTSSRKRRKPKTLHKPIQRLDSDSEIEFETRRSTRSNRPAKSMRDPDIDEDYDAVEDYAPYVPKIAAIKETFHEVSEESGLGEVHSAVCETCGTMASHGKGSLIPCQGCSYSYHKLCIGNRSQRDHRVTKVSENQFVLQCRFCIRSSQKDKRVPDYSICQTCKIPGLSCAEFSTKKTPKQEEKARLENGGEDPITHVQPNLVNNAANVLFRCSTCKRGYHLEHLPPIDPDRVGSGDVRYDRIHEYSLEGWKCKECLEATHKIHALVAWRPADQSSYQNGRICDEFGSDEIEYLVKWDGRSHAHDSWMPGAWVYGIAASAMRTAFHKREENKFPKMTIESAVEEEWVLSDVFLEVKYRRGFSSISKEKDLAGVKDVVSVFVKFQGLSYEEAVWDEPPPRSSKSRWDAFNAAYEEFLNGKYFPSANEEKMRQRVKIYRGLDFKTECELKTQPVCLKAGRTLMPYQMEGVNWLLYNFHQQVNVVLADEMGLGKTIQIVSFVSSLALGQPKCWPFLIVVPNATCPNWRRELKDWSPSLRVVTYHGGKASQELAYRHELFPNGVKDGMKAHVVIMSFEAASTIKGTFQGVKWAGLIVDEGQRLKNDETQLYKTLVDLNIPCRILLTGTPLQNNKRELFNLLQFIQSDFNAEKMDAEYGELTKENLPKLHDLIRPHFLRRTKVQVLKFLPPMAQVIVPVTMTVLQERLSKSIMARNPELIKAIVSKGKMKAADRKNLSNIVADLRQCLCHPFCFNQNIEDKEAVGEQMRRNLIEASPKFMLLEIMLPKLKERGHRILIFSQFLRCLDILEDFLNELGLQYGRIDGNLSALKKQKQIDAFNAPDSPMFAMLLSTRAGGVGINLASADTVIIYDPDWNPHQDIQAISRAHRIGQKEKVLCFQLTTKNTIEENIMQAGRKKMALDHALIESLDAEDDGNRDLESILKQGAESLFSDKDKVKITYDSASVDRLLDRSQMESTNADDETAETQFSIARVWANDSGSLTNNFDTSDKVASAADASVWENILKLREEEHQRELAAKQEVYGRGARRRAKGVDYNNGQQPGPDSGGSGIDDDLYTDAGIDPDNDDDEDDEAYGEEERALSKNKRAKAPMLATTTPSANPTAAYVATAHGEPLAMAKELATQAINTSHDNHRNKNHPAGAIPQARATPTTTLPPNQPMSWTQIPPPQRPQLHTSLHSNTHLNPNGVVPMPNRVLPSSTNISHPISNASPSIPSQKALRWRTQILTPQPQPQPPPPNSQHSNGLTTSLHFPTDIRGCCLICKAPHPPNRTCVDFGSQISLRIAIDSLRINGDQPDIRAFRDLLVNQLRRISGGQ